MRTENTTGNVEANFSLAIASSKIIQSSYKFLKLSINLFNSAGGSLTV